MKRYVKADITDILDDDLIVQKDYANSDNARPATLARLADSPFSVVRMCVAKNPNTSKETIEKLVHDELPKVRELARLSPHIDHDTFRTLKTQDVWRDAAEYDFELWYPDDGGTNEEIEKLTKDLVKHYHGVYLKGIFTRSINDRDCRYIFQVAFNGDDPSDMASFNYDLETELGDAEYTVYSSFYNQLMQK